MTSTKMILLTGAGFTHNFGTPLASGMWCEIFNDKEVQIQKNIRKLMLENMDYESVFASITEGNYSISEKDAINNAIIRAYDKLDNTVIDYHFTSDSPNPINIYKVQKLINTFADLNKTGFFFTVNQDLFIERHYYNGKRPIMPGIKIPNNWFSSNFTSHLQKTDYYQLPDEGEIEKNKEIITQSGNFFYIKLHGSQNWESYSGNKRMVIGNGKLEQIKKEPLLSWYYEIFKKTFTEKDQKLLVIGYGFGDEHINEVISNAVKENKLRVYIISPEAVDKFREKLVTKNHGIDLWSGLAGYFPYSLLQMFPGDQSSTQFYKNVENHYFETNTR